MSALQIMAGLAVLAVGTLIMLVVIDLLTGNDPPTDMWRG